MLQITYTPPAVNPLLALLAAKPAGEFAMAEELLAKAKELVPVAPEDGGALKESGIAIPDTANGADVVFSAVNEDGGYDYAAIQHENLHYHHTTGQAKYLEGPMNNEHDAILGAAHAAMAPLL